MPRSTFSTAVIPTKLDLLIHFVTEHESNDDFLQGAHDEVYANTGLAWDSANLFVENNKTKVREEKISIVNKDLTGTREGKHYENGRPPFPLLVHSFNLEETPTFPRTCNIELYVIEEDNGRLGEEFKKYDGLYRTKLAEAIEKGGEKVFATLGGIILGKVGGEIGAKIGKEASKLIKNSLGKLIDVISKGLANDVLQPFRFRIEIPEPQFEFGRNSSSLESISSGLLDMDYKDEGAHYVITYEWVLRRRFELFVKPFPFLPRSTMSNDSFLKSGQKLISKNGKYQLIYDNGLLSLQRVSDGTFLWTSGSESISGGRCVMQKDGNLVIYKNDGTPVWDSGTFGNCYIGAKVVMQDDAGLVIYAKNGKAVWDTATFNETPSLAARPAARPCS